MPVTAINRNTALLVIDLQQGIRGLPVVHPIEVVVHHAAALADAFRRHRLPVVLVAADGRAPGRTEQPSRGTKPLPPGWTDLMPELDQQPEDHVLTKQRWGAFTGTGLEAHLRSRNVTQLVIAGVATSAGVDSTARHAHELGFHVTLAIDAMTDLDPEAHAHSIARIFPRIGETGCTQDILELLERSRA